MSQPPKKKNRGQLINLTPIHEFSNKNNIKVRCPDQLNTEEEINNLKKQKPDVVVVVAYGKLLPSKFLNFEKFISRTSHAHVRMGCTQ